MVKAPWHVARSILAKAQAKAAKTEKKRRAQIDAEAAAALAADAPIKPAKASRKAGGQSVP